MTKDIIQMAREANRYASNQTDDSHDWHFIRDERFATLVRAAALEEAAEVCLKRSHREDDMGAMCAAAIQKLKNKP